MAERLILGSLDITKWVKQKTGLAYGRENTNDADAGRDESDEMHTNVRSHQRKLTLKLGPMSFEEARQVESVLQGHDDGVSFHYPDLADGWCTRLFYNTSIEAAEEQFLDDGDELVIDNVSFTLISVKEDTV